MLPQRLTPGSARFLLFFHRLTSLADSECVLHRGCLPRAAVAAAAAVPAKRVVDSSHLRCIYFFSGVTRTRRVCTVGDNQVILASYLEALKIREKSSSPCCSRSPVPALASGRRGNTFSSGKYTRLVLLLRKPIRLARM